MYHYTYMITSASGKYYVGRHSTSNIDDGYMGSGKWIRSIKDKSDLIKHIIKYYNDYDELLQDEKTLISEHIDNPNNMNFNNNPVGFASGDLNYNTTPEGRRKASERMKRNNHMKKGHTEESKRKISESMTGDKNHFYGKTHSEESRQKISKAHKGRTFSDETRALWSEQRKGKPAWNKGVKGAFSMNEEGKKKISDSWNRREKKTCEHCGKDGLAPHLYSRWHGDNCKQK